MRPLTAGEWMVVGDGTENGLVGVDEQHGIVYFLANEASPLERHLYVDLARHALTRARQQHLARSRLA